MASLLRTRAITGIIFSIIVLALLIKNSFSATILLALIAILSSYEYGRLVYSESKVLKIATVTVSALVPIAAIWNMEFGSSTYRILLYIALAWALINIANLYTKNNIIPHKKLGMLVSALYIGIPIGLFISLINNLTPYDYLLPVGIIVLIWMSDSMAYLVGSRIGKTKLFPSVSPNKTWEGTLGAGIFTILAAFGICFLKTEFTLAWYDFLKELRIFSKKRMLNYSVRDITKSKILETSSQVMEVFWIGLTALSSCCLLLFYYICP